jgi:hypothetical protein
MLAGPAVIAGIIWSMKRRTFVLAGTAACASLCLAVESPSLAPESASPPSTQLLPRLKHALDSDQLLQESFFTDENLKTFFDATSIQWFNKDDDPPHIGKVVIVKSALLPKADIRVSSLFLLGAGKVDPGARRISISMVHVRLTQDEVIAVFGTPVAWTRHFDPHGDSIPLPLHFGDVEGTAQRAWDGTTKKGASFSAVPDGSVDGILVMALGHVDGAAPHP